MIYIILKQPTTSEQVYDAYNATASGGGHCIYLITTCYQPVPAYNAKESLWTWLRVIIITVLIQLLSDIAIFQRGKLADEDAHSSRNYPAAQNFRPCLD